MCIVQSVTGHAGREERKTERSCYPETQRETRGKREGRGRGRMLERREEGGRDRETEKKL